MILFLSNADTDLLALRVAVESLPAGFPALRAGNPDRLATPPPLDGVDIVLVRLLSGRKAWEGPFDALRAGCVARRIPLLAFGGEATPDAELTALSTVDSAAVAEALPYLQHGGPANIANLLRCLAGHPHERAVPVADTGIYRDAAGGDGPLIGIVFYRSHLVAGNTQFVDDLCDAVERRGARARAVWCYSLRGRPDTVELLRPCDAVITTVLAAGADDGDDGWTNPLADLDVPVVQAIAATSPHDAWAESAAGLAPIDVAMQVAIPEFDGRIITVPFSFKEVVDDGDDLGAPVNAYRTIGERTDRAAGVTVRLARLRSTPPAARRVAIVLSAYPTKRSRIGNAVGLDTPASVIELLHALRAAGHGVDRVPDNGDALMAELADGLTYDVAALTPAQIERAAGRMTATEYERTFATLPADLQKAMIDAWGPPPGEPYVSPARELVFPGLELGHVGVFVQPPRGFGANPIAVYHSPDLSPTHHYVAFYRWLDEVWRADAVVHVGKHGSLEWLPGKGVGLSAACGPDAVLGDVPLFYPFVVNDPGEGTQAKRRAHAVIVDHLVPPMTRADTYDELARLERLLDAYYQVETLDPTKLAAIQAEVWDLLVSASLHRDLGVDGMPAAEEFGTFVQHIDGYLCELKDAQIRGGLHVLGRAPEGEARLDMVAALTRLPQGSVPSLRATVAADLGTDDVDALEAESRRRLTAVAERDWNYAGTDPTLRWVADRLVPALGRTPDEIAALLHGLSGGHVAAGPSGAPTRGMAHVLPTGRNFYSVDPKALPSPLAWEVGRRLADEVVARHEAEDGRPPETVGLVIWGTAAMRTMGDDVAEVLALLGVRPVWQPESGRVVGIEAIPLVELGRPRIDVTLRISGFFRDAFPGLVALLDDAVSLVAALDEPPDQNFVRAHGIDDPRIYGPKPGAYGAGILAVIDSGDWETADDLAAVYRAWSGWSYRRGRFGAADPEAMARRFAAIDVAVKNQDNREHDIFDSDDYLQEHGGMVVAARVFSGRSVKAWFGDTADPARPRVRSLAEEAARVVRTRVVNPKWIAAMQRHGYKGAFEMAATVDYLFGYDATAGVVDDWMYERVTAAYVGDPEVRKFFEQSNPWALRAIAERLLEADERGLWDASPEARGSLQSALLEAEGWEERRWEESR
jgi:cobaltochelatase CobN